MKNTPELNKKRVFKDIRKNNKVDKFLKINLN